MTIEPGMSNLLSYRVVRLAPSALVSDSIVMACAGQMASHSLQAMHRSSPVAYRRRACSPLNLGPIAPFSNGYMMVLWKEEACQLSNRKATIHFARDLAALTMVVGRSSPGCRHDAQQEVISRQ